MAIGQNWGQQGTIGAVSTVQRHKAGVSFVTPAVCPGSGTSSRQGEGDHRIVGFRRSTGTDVISLYADDTLLYLGDTQDSLVAAMGLIKVFGTLSGFSINWNKSVLMPLDPLTDPLPDSASMVQIVPSFRCLGVQVSPDVTQYINLIPLLTKFREKCNTWCKLPLSVVGRANLIKMVWSSQLLYICHNSPVWIPF